MIIREMTAKECYEFLSQTNFGRLGCARDNQPYVIPTYFAYDRKHLYCFSNLGQKINWMRANPLVCIEVDEVVNQLHWKSIVVLGKYQELCDIPSCLNLREYALELLQKRAMWWQPAYVATEQRGSRALTPVFYRIQINQITGHRGTPDSLEEAASTIVANTKPKAQCSLLS
ncbi:MAG: pyridoxamine 5'-phosphate oxidase family protein [Pyrinomonadaceae bacterium]|nr:pyridoxamine 5'-phosphate oxidase family protein [Pyrinomonadaceae bacterium]